MRGRPGAFTLGALVVTLVSMLLFDEPITRIIGVAAMFAFIISGVFLIASPSYIEKQDEA
jgi:drug/metabolite transporter (DMT)-like permease